MPRNRHPVAPTVAEWEDPKPLTRKRSTPRRSLGSVLASPFAVLLALFLIPLSGAVYYASVMPEQYTGRALVQFRPRATANGGVVGNETTASAAAGYGAFLGTPSTIRSVAGQIGVRAADLRDNMAVQLVPATTSLTITFKDSTPDVAARGASALAQYTVERATDDPLVSATVLAPAAVPDAPSTPPKVVVIAAGAVLGLLLAAIAHFVLAGRTRSLAKSADARRSSRSASTESVPDPAGHTSEPALSTR